MKVVHGIAEQGRVSVRNVRRDTMQDLREMKKDGEIGADDEHRAETELQKLTDLRVRTSTRCSPAKRRRSWESLIPWIGHAADSARATWPSSPTATGAGPRTGGCRRWPASEAGADTVKARLRDAARLGIEELTVYSFSTENWTRPRPRWTG